MSKQMVMSKVDTILAESGLKVHRDYIWSLQGPTLIYLGTKDPFRGITISELQSIKDLGVKFLMEP